MTLASRILLRNILSQNYRIEENAIFLDSDENGKPFIVGNPFEISISHSADTVAVAISESVVGIDIEKIRKTDLNLMKRFFEDEDISYVLGDYQSVDDYNGYSSPSVLKRFFEVWTKKEAASKLDGRGLSVVQKISLCDYSFETVFTEEEKYVISVCVGKK